GVQTCALPIYIEENFAFFKGGYTDFGPLEVTQNSHMTPQSCGNLTNFIRAHFVIFRRAVRKVHTYNVGTRRDNFFKIIIAICCWAYRVHYFCSVKYTGLVLISSQIILMVGSWLYLIDIN